MQYHRVLEIDDRLDAVLRLIKTGKFSAPAISKEVGVSMSIISRIVATMRERGQPITAKRTLNGWRYVLDRINTAQAAR